MKTTIEHSLPVTIEQVLAWVRQCTVEEKEIIIHELLNESGLLLRASEQVLAKEWLSKEEEEAWKDL